LNTIIKNIIISFCFAFILFAGKAYAQYSEYEIKAAYIFNFAKFISSDRINESDTLIIGLYKNNPFDIALEKTLLGRKANGKYWKIVNITTKEQITNCHFLFISDIPKYEYYNLLKYSKTKEVITIGDEIELFCEDGGIINFTPQHSKNRFEINNHIALQNNIHISPKLLILSKLISDNEDEF